MAGPRNLDELRAVRDPAQRALAAAAYIEQREQAIAEARSVRDDAIRALLGEHGPTKTARMCGVSVSHVKLAAQSSQTRR